MASVVPDVTGAFREMAAAYLSHEPVIVGPGMKTGVSVVTDNPREVGADRVVNTLAAFTAFGGPAIVVDFGTSTNFDVVSDTGEFLGGVIAPGLQISAARWSAGPRGSPASTCSRRGRRSVARPSRRSSRA